MVHIYILLWRLTNGWKCTNQFISRIFWKKGKNANFPNFYVYTLVIRIRNYEGNNKADWLISFLDAIIQVSLSQRILIHDYIFCFILFFQISEASIIIGIWLHIHIILVKKEWRGFSISKKWAFGGFFLIHLFVMVEAFFFHIFSLFLPKVKYNPKMLSFF